MTEQNIDTVMNELYKLVPALRSINNDVDYAAALACVEQLCNDKADQNLINWLTASIHAYERQQADRQRLDPDTHEMMTGVAALKTLMNNRGMKGIDLANETNLGSPSLISQIINGKRALTIPNIKILADYFNVDQSVFY
ncbi:helix-turn-helix domain-containing protein [Citrobacter portucalensis]|uniref:helix-turn-helix domain-containing protein n=1 Tax=Citrobacter portucalensis TaxID=1639133 RepID=UPI0031404136